MEAHAARGRVGFEADVEILGAEFGRGCLDETAVHAADAVRPRFGGYLVAAWLGGIIVNLLMVAGFYDIALRDFRLLLAALALARPATVFPHRSSLCAPGEGGRFALSAVGAAFEELALDHCATIR